GDLGLDRSSIRPAGPLSGRSDPRAPGSREVTQGAISTSRRGAQPPELRLRRLFQFKRAREPPCIQSCHLPLKPPSRRYHVQSAGPVAEDRLVQALRDDSNLELDVLRLATEARTDGQRADCLRRALRLNPHSERATRGLANLHRR